jgi:hypothetical protein
MKYIPIVPHFEPQVSITQQEKVDRLAERLLLERPELAPPEIFRPFIPDTLHQAPSLHVDDLSAVSRLKPTRETSFFQDRARLRAGDDDVLLTCGSATEGYPDYCADFLGLGRPTWLHPVSPGGPLRVAEAAWEDRSVRRELVHRIRNKDLQYLHPHMGTLPIWELALLLGESSHHRFKVIAPTPEVTRWANDKVAFTETVTQLFGESAAPRSRHAWNESTLVSRMKELSEGCSFVGVKLPNSAGGDGNFVFDASDLQQRTAPEIQELVQSRIGDRWSGKQPMLIDVWETDVLCSPSVQTWIPPQKDCSPVVEGVFVQATEGQEGVFVGSQPAQFPHALTQEIVDRSWLLAKLFQNVGYIGRCSFDLVLIGESLGSCHIEFIECNGRWGGTSLPMLLMNRLFNDWVNQPYVVHLVQMPGLDRIPFSQLLDCLGDELYDRRTGKGQLILFNAARMKQYSSIPVVSLGDTWAAAARNAFERTPELFHELVQKYPNCRTGDGQQAESGPTGTLHL